jgi:hypothetical protein
MLVALLALVMAISGSAVAASLITSAQIKDGTIQTKDISKKAQKALKGKAGLAGARGAQGLQGNKGDTGPKGDSGATGPKGDSGATGPKGVTGQPGADGAPAFKAWAKVVYTAGAPTLATSSPGVTVADGGFLDGVAEVTFPAPVTQASCAVAATIDDTTSGVIRKTSSGSSGSMIRILTYVMDGLTLTDKSFDVIVTC